mgnify:CR=1 FL=1|jgi:hypothetical protein
MRDELLPDHGFFGTGSAEARRCAGCGCTAHEG